MHGKPSELEAGFMLAGFAITLVAAYLSCKRKGWATFDIRSFDILFVGLRFVFVTYLMLGFTLGIGIIFAEILKNL